VIAEGYILKMVSDKLCYVHINIKSARELMEVIKHRMMPIMLDTSGMSLSLIMIIGICPCVATETYNT
jgi:hypothetical protein